MVKRSLKREIYEEIYEMINGEKFEGKDKDLYNFVDENENDGCNIEEV